MSLKRTGWVDHKVRDPERVAGHMFRMALMAVTLEEEETVVGRHDILGGSAAVVSLLHDVAECIVGDLGHNSIDAEALAMLKYLILILMLCRNPNSSRRPLF